MNEQPLWSWSFTTLVISNFFGGLVFYLLATTIANYAMDCFHTTPAAAGVAVGIYAFGTVLVRILTGHCMEAIGARRLVQFGTIVYAVLAFGYFVAESYALLLVIRFLHGCMFGLSNTALNTLAIQSIPCEKQGEGTAFLTLSPTMATAIGPFVGILLTRSYPYEAVLWVCAACSVASAVLVLCSRVPPDPPCCLSRLAFSRLSDFFEPNALPASIVMILLSMCYAAVTAFMSDYASSIGLSAAASMFFVVYAAGILLFRPSAGKLLDRRGENHVMYPALLIFAGGFVLMSLAHSSILFLSSAVCLAAGYGTIQSSGHAIAIRHSPPERAGLATATYYACTDTGICLGPSILGIYQPVLGYRRMFLSLAGVVLLGAFCYYFLHGRKQATHWKK